MSYEPNPNHERGILCRQIKDDVINHLRSHRSDGQLTIDQVFIAALGCRVKACGRYPAVSPEDVAEQHCGKSVAYYQLLLETMNNLPRLEIARLSAQR